MVKDQVGTRKQKGRRELEGTDLAMVDSQADLKEITRLIEMGVLRKPVEGEEVEKYTHLTTKVVRDWRRRPGWTRRSRLVAREFKSSSPWTQEMFAPASNLGTVHSFLVWALSTGLEVVSLDIKDAYLQVPQPSPAVITVDAKVFGSEQEGQVTYVLERLLPRPACRGKRLVHLRQGDAGGVGNGKFSKGTNAVQKQEHLRKVGNDFARRRRTPGFIKKGNANGS